MSLTREITIWCDQCGVWIQKSGMTAGRIRKGLKKEGWTVIRHYSVRDYCPECSRKREEVLNEFVDKEI